MSIYRSEATAVNIIKSTLLNMMLDHLPGRHAFE